MAVASTGCGGESPPVRSIGREFETSVSAVRVCADGDTVPGIDVSKWQGAIDWSQVHEAGILFAFIRVSHGTGILDEYFEDNWASAASVGILRGAYQYFSPTQDPIEQADLLLDRLATQGAGELPPVIDVEETQDLDPATIADRVGRWLEHVESELGVRPIIYTGPYFWNTYVETDAFSDYPLWIANWGVSCPNLPTAWSDWVFWQTSSTGRIAGISGNVDTDVFNGDYDALLAFAGDPECRVDPDYSECAGDILRYCNDSGRLSSIDCATTGEICQPGTTGARCVAPIPDEAPDAGGDEFPDAGEPDMGDSEPDGETSDGEVDESVIPEAEPANPPGLSRFARVGEAGLGKSGCQTVGHDPYLGLLPWLLVIAAGYRRRSQRSPPRQGWSGDP